MIQSDDWLGKKDAEEVDEALFIEFFQHFYKLFYSIDRQGGELTFSAKPVALTFLNLLSTIVYRNLNFNCYRSKCFGQRRTEMVSKESKAIWPGSLRQHVRNSVRFHAQEWQE